MGFFSNKIPTAKKTEKIMNKVMILSQELKNIIISHNCVDFKKVNVAGLDYALFLYDLEFYRQLMGIKYSKSFIEVVIRTICISIDDNLQKAGNAISKNYTFNTFKKLSHSLNQIYAIASEDEIDEFFAIAMYLCSDECQMIENEINQNKQLVFDITAHFKKIINLPYKEI